MKWPWAGKQSKHETSFDTVMSRAANDLRKLVGDVPEPSREFALVLGGIVAAHQAVENIPVLRPLWGEGDTERAEALSEVCSLALVSRFLTVLETEDHQLADERESARALWGQLVLSVFGGFSDEALIHFMDVDKQHVWEQHTPNEGGGRWVLERILILAAAIRALGGDYPIGNLPSSGYPYEGLEDFRARGGASYVGLANPADELTSYVAIESCLATGMKAAGRYLQGHYC